MESFGHLSLDELPSLQELWQETLNKTEAQKPAQNLFLEESSDVDNLHELVGMCLEDTGKGEEHTN